MLIDIVKSPASSLEEECKALENLFQMYVHEQENLKDFVYQQTEKTIDDVLYGSLHVLGQLARSHTSACVL